jgi:hypothetical protein
MCWNSFGLLKALSMRQRSLYEADWLLSAAWVGGDGLRSALAAGMPFNL